MQLATTSLNGKDAGLTELRRNCPSVQTDFWQCMNRTLHGKFGTFFNFNVNVNLFVKFSFQFIHAAVYRGAEWSGRTCCQHAITVNCQNTCAISMSSQDTLTSCRRSDEQTLFDCFERQQQGDNCCGSARTSECLQVSNRVVSSIDQFKKMLKIKQDLCCF